MAVRIRPSGAIANQTASRDGLAPFVDRGHRMVGVSGPRHRFRQSRADGVRPPPDPFHRQATAWTVFSARSRCGASCGGIHIDSRAKDARSTACGGSTSRSRRPISPKRTTPKTVSATMPAKDRNNRRIASSSLTERRRSARATRKNRTTSVSARQSFIRVHMGSGRRTKHSYGESGGRDVHSCLKCRASGPTPRCPEWKAFACNAFVTREEFKHHTGVMPLAASCLVCECQTGNPLGTNRRPHHAEPQSRTHPDYAGRPR